MKHEQTGKANEGLTVEKIQRMREILNASRIPSDWPVAMFGTRAQFRSLGISDAEIDEAERRGRLVFTERLPVPDESPRRLVAAVVVSLLAAIVVVSLVFVL